MPLISHLQPNRFLLFSLHTAWFLLFPMGGQIRHAAAILSGAIPSPLELLDDHQGSLPPFHSWSTTAGSRRHLLSVSSRDTPPPPTRLHQGHTSLTQPTTRLPSCLQQGLRPPAPGRASPDASHLHQVAAISRFVAREEVVLLDISTRISEIWSYHMCQTSFCCSGACPWSGV